MKNLIAYGILMTSLLFAGCGSAEKENAADNEKQVLISHIDSLQKKMVNPQTMELDKGLAAQGVEAFENFVAKYPDDSLCAEYLFRASDLSRGLGDNQKAMDCLKHICLKYPDYKKIPDCIFLQGYYNQEFFGDTAAAKAFYKDLLSKYPDHPFADDAAALMNMFGKTEEDIIKEFEKNAAAQKKN